MKHIEAFLKSCLIVSINNDIKERYEEILKQYHLKLPDAIIAATAVSINIPLITSDKQFATVKEVKLVYYQM